MRDWGAKLWSSKPPFAPVSPFLALLPVILQASRASLEMRPRAKPLCRFRQEASAPVFLSLPLSPLYAMTSTTMMRMGDGSAPIKAPFFRWLRLVAPPTSAMAQTLFTGIWDAQEQLAFVRDNFPGCAVRRLANYKFEGGGLRSSPSFSGFSMFFHSQWPTRSRLAWSCLSLTSETTGMPT